MGALRRHATTIVLAALALVALAVVLVVDKGTISTNEAERRKQNVFEAWRIDEVTEVAMSSGGRTTVLRRTKPDDAGQSSWEVEIDGQRFAAEAQVVDQFMGTLEFATYERRVPPSSVDRRAFGLEAPRTTIAVAMGRLAMKLAIGGPAPTPAGAAYAEASDRVFVVTPQLVAALDVSPDRFRSRSFVPYLSVDIDGLVLDGAGGARHLRRAPWGSGRGAGWRFDGTTPEGNVRASAQAVDRIFDALGRMQAESYLPTADAERAATREVTLRMIPADGSKKPGVLTLGGPCPGNGDLVVALREPGPLAACVSKAALEALGTPTAEIVDRQLVGAPLDEITEVTLTKGDQKIELARSGPGWHLRAPTDRPIDADVGRGFVESLLGLRGDALVSGDPSALGLVPPRATVRVVSSSQPRAEADGGEGSTRTEVLEVGAEKGDAVIVRRVEDGAILSLSKHAADDLLPSELTLRPRRVVDEPAKHFVALDIRAGAIKQRLLRTDDGAWNLASPTGPGLKADLGLASDVVDVLSSLRADRWVAARDDGSFGLDPPRVVIEADLSNDGEGDAGAPRKLRVVLGAAAASGSFAKVSGDDGVFLAPKALEDIAARWLLARSALRIDPAEVATVTIQSGPKRARVERVGEAWKIVGAPDDEASKERAAAIRDALADMLAEGAVSIGKPLPDQGFDPPRAVVTIERSSGEPRTVRITLGAGDAWRGSSIVYARRDGVDATYALPKATVRPLLDVL